MVPTEKALAFLPKIRALLPSIEVPSQSTKSFTIASPDHIASGFLGEITAPLRREASSCTLVIRSRGPDDNFERALLRVEGDIAIGSSPSHRNIYANPIPYGRPVVCLMREEHPLDHGSISEGDDLFAAHSTPVSYTASYRDGVETYFGTLRTNCHRTPTLSCFSIAPCLLLDSDPILLTGQHLPRYPPLKISKPPITFPELTFYRLRHIRAHHSLEHRWIYGGVLTARHMLWARS